MDFYKLLKVGKPKKSEEIVLKEDEIDFDFLIKCYLTEDLDIWKETRQALLKYILTRENDNEVTYKPSEKQMGFGRLYGETSMQGLYKMIRNGACTAYTDVDIKNCHPVLLLQICKRLSWDCDELEKYVLNREEYIKEVMEFYECDRDTAKSLFIRILYGGKFNKWLSDFNINNNEQLKFIKKLEKEFDEILNNHFETNSKGSEIVKDIMKDKKKKNELKDNPKSSALSITLQIEENRILEETIKFFKSQGVHVKVLCFDGCMVKTCDKLTDDLLRKLEQHINLKTSWVIEYDYKPMNEKFKIEDLITIKTDNEEEKFLNRKHIEELNFYRLQKPYFEKFFSLLENPSSICKQENNKIDFLTLKDFELLNKQIKSISLDDKNKIKPARFIDKWLNDNDIKRFRNVVFQPPPQVINPEELNLFTGFKADDKSITPEGSTQILYDHLFNLSGREKEGYEYLLNYISHLFQKPGELPGISLLFTNETQGVGKNMFFDALGKNILGSDYYLQTENIDNVIGKNNLNQNKLLITLDEASGKDTFTNSETIKNLITAEELVAERKYINSYKINNYGRYIFFSNNETPIKVEQKDRRFVIYRPNDDFGTPEEKLIYFQNLKKAVDNKNLMKKFYLELKERDISNLNLLNRYISKEYEEIKKITKCRVLSFIIKYCYDIIEDSQLIDNRVDDLYLRYLDFCKDNNFKDQMNVISFCKKLIKIKGVSNRKTKGIKVYTFDKNIITNNEEEEIF